MYVLMYICASQLSTIGGQTPNPALNRIACKLRLQVLSTSTSGGRLALR